MRNPVSEKDRRPEVPCFIPCYGWQQFHFITLPAALPMIITGLRLGFGYSWRALMSRLFGYSGCGKTTLLRHIAGIEQPDSGTINFDQLAERQKQGRARLGVVFQEPRLLPWLTVAEFCSSEKDYSEGYLIRHVGLWNNSPSLRKTRLSPCLENTNCHS